MSACDLASLLPYGILAATVIVVMLAIAVHRNHLLMVWLSISGLVLALLSTSGARWSIPHAVTPLLEIDPFARFFLGLILLSAGIVAVLSYSYLEKHEGHREEFYLLLLLASLGCTILAAAAHFASFFLGIELLSVSLYALAAYLRHSPRSVEAGVKYLILAAVSSAFILFGMALVYAETGNMAFNWMQVPALGDGRLVFLAGIGLILVGIGFKLALVPFHLWTPDVYEGAPAPVTAFIATASKGAVFAVLLRFLSRIDLAASPGLILLFTVVAVASMFAGNLLALRQTNVKRILAYSSIAHLGYLTVTLLASGAMAVAAAAFYLAAYTLTTLGAFGVVTVLSGKEEDADRLDAYYGLAWRNPWLAGAFTAMLLSLAGIPLTAGFIGKFYVITAGVGSALWFLVMILVVNSVIGLFYYLRIILVLYRRADTHDGKELSLSGSAIVAGLTVLLVWIGIYPAPVLASILRMVQGMR